MNGAEYKWKVADNGTDLVVRGCLAPLRRSITSVNKGLIRAHLQCLSTQLSTYGKNVAEWSQENLVLRVSERVESILDRIVVTCIINMWMKYKNLW